jgi:hypothetical protein
VDCPCITGSGLWGLTRRESKFGSANASGKEDEIAAVKKILDSKRGRVIPSS